MKIWKMVGSLALLAVIICGCVILGNNAEVSASTPPEQEGEQVQESEKSEEERTEGSVTVSKTYSTGLDFRSNGDGTCAVSGVGSCTSACILIPPTSPAGDTVTAILPYAFAEGIVGAIELPSTVTTLTAESFAGCVRLSYVRVASGNTSFLEYDGVLYTADGTTLLYCPAARSATTLQLHPSLRRIAAGAFSACSELATVCFNGTTAEWHGVIVGDDNEALYAARMKFEG
ncbi:MAG: leucine-rich repeat protein [Clostridia bacterium]|nr:leucine-rich repeat protein [Clostridia bacterium]